MEVQGPLIYEEANLYHPPNNTQSLASYVPTPNINFFVTVLFVHRLHNQ